MYERFSIVFFHSAGSDVLQMETTTFSFGRPVSWILHDVIYSFWGFIKDSIYVPPLSTPIQKLRDQIMHALQAITADMLHRVWYVFNYHVVVCHVTQGAQIEGL
jgi:hypothetical protein